MPRDQHYWVYILASWPRVLYIGVTSDIEGRLYEHRTEDLRSFTSRYRVHRLVYVEEYTWVDDAIAREKQLKAWRRSKKVALIESENPEWSDLSTEWCRVSCVFRCDVAGAEIEMSRHARNDKL